VKRPYDLRHACVSVWLAAGVEPTRVAAWAGHSVAVLLRVYAKFLDGGEQDARAKVERLLGVRMRTSSIASVGVPCAAATWATATSATIAVKLRKMCVID
jgi:hypothetical protein